eukprot:COSAG03_NODE_2423_length_2785_cov_40.476545_3_plen_161_part_00
MSVRGIGRVRAAPSCQRALPQAPPRRNVSDKGPSSSLPSVASIHLSPRRCPPFQYDTRYSTPDREVPWEVPVHRTSTRSIENHWRIRPRPRRRSGGGTFVRRPRQPPARTEAAPAPAVPACSACVPGQGARGCSEFEGPGVERGWDGSVAVSPVVSVGPS